MIALEASSGPHAVRLFLVHADARAGQRLAAALNGLGRVRLLGQVVAPSPAAVERLLAPDVDVVAIDAFLDGSEETALRLVEELRQRRPRLEIVALGIAAPAEVLRFAEAGATAYLPAEAPADALAETVAMVAAGATRCSPEVAKALFERLVELSPPRRKDAKAPTDVVTLTKRELEVLRLVGEGRQNKEIAKSLRVTLPTVKNHVHRIFEKLGARSRRDAVYRACEAGWLEDTLYLRPPSPAR